MFRSFVSLWLFKKPLDKQNKSKAKATRCQDKRLTWFNHVYLSIYLWDLCHSKWSGYQFNSLLFTGKQPKRGDRGQSWTFEVEPLGCWIAAFHRFLGQPCAKDSFSSWFLVEKGEFVFCKGFPVWTAISESWNICYMTQIKQNIAHLSHWESTWDVNWRRAKWLFEGGRICGWACRSCN